MCNNSDININKDSPVALNCCHKQDRKFRQQIQHVVMNVRMGSEVYLVLKLSTHNIIIIKNIIMLHFCMNKSHADYNYYTKLDLQFNLRDTETRQKH